MVVLSKVDEKTKKELLAMNKEDIKTYMFANQSGIYWTFNQDLQIMVMGSIFYDESKMRAVGSALDYFKFRYPDEAEAILSKFSYPFEGSQIRKITDAEVDRIVSTALESSVILDRLLMTIGIEEAYKLAGISPKANDDPFKNRVGRTLGQIR